MPHAACRPGIERRTIQGIHERRNRNCSASGGWSEPEHGLHCGLAQTSNGEPLRSSAEADRGFGCARALMRVIRRNIAHQAAWPREIDP